MLGRHAVTRRALVGHVMTSVPVVRGRAQLPVGRVQPNTRDRYLPPEPSAITYVSDTAVWGANLWNVLHTIAEFSDTLASASLWRDLLNLLTIDIPCTECRVHFSTYLQNNPVDVTDRRMLVPWLFNLHNMVNTRIGKPVLTDVPSLPYGTRATLLNDLIPVIQSLSVSFPPAVIEVLQNLVTELA